MKDHLEFNLYQQVLDILPTPVLIKDHSLRYVFINTAFEQLFQVERENIIGHLDSEVFKDRQVSQCNGGDLRVLATGDIDEAYESVFNREGEQREVITRKNRLVLTTGEVFLVGTIHDITEVSQINQKLLASQTKLKYQSQQLEIMAATDPLTGCDNRRCLETKLPSLFAQANNNGGLLALDIDHFKRINDSFGHQMGDVVLKTFTDIIRAQISEKIPFIRMGGEEFLLAYPGATYEELSHLANTIRERVASYDQWPVNAPLSITVSIGLSHSTHQENWHLESLIHQADEALYQAKDQGRNRVITAHTAGQ
ncbi:MULTISPECIES: GGDEF domain-containing protein [unclassified Vibrio]|uniref:diguanylate cyclase n=1 Tax=Vibrio sp. HB236076 TaxID=3232307 RepID=A0AB39HI92_9VIBR|nr:GGDEF domain-containing protein [Vibrio sp. HB161653]MDP5252728.1 GGDEF domain-containing protein [Vibrio sp. HB161653]